MLCYLRTSYHYLSGSTEAYGAFSHYASQPEPPVCLSFWLPDSISVSFSAVGDVHTQPPHPTSLSPAQGSTACDLCGLKQIWYFEQALN